MFIVAAPEPPAPVEPPKTLVGVRPVSVGFDAAKAKLRMLKELGATVVVEDELPKLPALPPDRRLLGFRLRSGDSFLPPGALAMPAWMDPSVTMSGGNAVSRVYSFFGIGR